MTNPDPRALRADDRLLDRLGRGEHIELAESVRGEDVDEEVGQDVEAMLAAWRHTLPVAGPPDPRLLAAITPKPRPRRLARATLGAAASVALVTGGVLVAAAYAAPDSPLWPVTRLMYGQLAESRQALDVANDEVSDARNAAAQGRYPEAARLLAAADALADEVDEPAAEQQLRRDIAVVRDKLAAALNHPTDTTRPAKPTDGQEVDPGEPPRTGSDHAPYGGPQGNHEQDGDHGHEHDGDHGNGDGGGHGDDPVPRIGDEPGNPQGGKPKTPHRPAPPELPEAPVQQPRQ